ncbi:polysaccharide pyruvyl transferase family protein [Weissella cibaria]|uniref:polysaccharide pyruvyl transferase family protein n=1 Tax=Weissella cibaria TaxID=137591 RepID=UPI001C1F6B21|nr:polysaccharide pyruvyl transferase family protein [Weissella cibaria]MBU7545407.1 polysaccharide pyruvyl transferase family protein [Weissella cibaria]MCV3318716.1 polysaccharide pyruvyl transferase family protein [Weissella cibaria]
MIKVFVSGYWKSNLGDDLFLKILCEKYPNVKFYVFLDRKNSRQFQRVANLTIIYNNLLFRLINKLLRKIGLLQVQDVLAPMLTDCFLEIGGSIFMQDDNWEYRLKQRAYARERYSQYFIIGSNFGPFYSQDYIEKYGDLFNKLNGISFRDSYSYNLFKVKNITRASDVIFGLRTNSYQFEYKKKQAVISVIDTSKKKTDTGSNFQDSYERKIIDIVDELTYKGYKVILMSFCDFEGDTTVVNRIYYHLNNNENVEIFEYIDDIDTAIRIISESEKVIASRFHAAVLGLMLGCQVLPIAYSGKMKNLIDDIYKEKKWMSIEEFINNGNLNDSNFVHLMRDEIEFIVSDSENQFMFFDNFIRSRNK